MKKAILIFFFSLCVKIAASQTATLNPTQVPKQITDAFIKEHPAVTAVWKADGKNFKAYYTDPKTKAAQLIVYDEKASVLKQESVPDKKEMLTQPNSKAPEAK